MSEPEHKLLCNHAKDKLIKELREMEMEPDEIIVKMKEFGYYITLEDINKRTL